MNSIINKLNELYHIRGILSFKKINLNINDLFSEQKNIKNYSYLKN